MTNPLTYEAALEAMARAIAQGGGTDERWDEIKHTQYADHVRDYVNQMLAAAESAGFVLVPKEVK